MAHKQDTFVPQGFQCPMQLCGGIVQAFFETLSPNEKELFKATTNAEQLLEEVKNADKVHKDKSVSRRIAQALKPFLAGIDQYGKALDVISKASSMVLCPIWGSIRIVLHLIFGPKLASEFGEYFEKISSLLQKIGLHLNTLRRFPRLYPHNERLESAMVDIYRVIFRFCTDTRNVFKKVSEKKVCQKGKWPFVETKKHANLILGMIGFRSLIKLVWKPFKAQFRDRQEELSSSMDKVSTEVEIAEKEEAHAERERADTERRVQAKRWDKTETTPPEDGFKIDQWLDPVNFESNHEAAVKLRHQGTENWFLECKAFKEWLQNDNAFLWLHAIPGAGKIVLVSSTVEFLKEQVKGEDVGLAYFYCDYKELRKQRKSVFQRLQTSVQDRCKENPASVPTHDELRGNFPTFLEGAFQQVILVVDAIDESTQRNCMIGDLKTFQKKCPFIKVLVSSREELDVIHTFKTFPGRGNYEFWLQVYESSKTIRHAHMAELKPLYFAASFGLPHTLRSLLEDGDDGGDDIDISTWAESDSDPIMEAVTQGHVGVVKIQLEHYDIKDEQRLAQYLYMASFKGHDDIVRYLLDKGMLLNAGASINGKGGWYAYPLISAIVRQNDIIIQILLNKGANVNLTGGRHVCALMAAAALGKLALVQKLIDAGARVNDENDKGADALHSACCAGHLDVVTLLLKSGADVNAKGGKYRNPLNAASSEGSISIVDLLLAAGALPLSIQITATQSKRPLERILEALIVAGADINTTVPSSKRSKYPSGWYGESTDVSAAASNKQTDAVRLLLNHSADPNLQCSNYGTALSRASGEGATEIVELLLAYGADVNLDAEPCDDEDDNGIITPLQGAAAFADEATVQLLVARGATL
ncbi:MAG: hypothetical protein Q9184_005556, partial [Pyrenodesmia sp. 2 TL-2023]